jgi:hypothetical protein
MNMFEFDLLAPERHLRLQFVAEVLEEEEWPEFCWVPPPA